MSCELESELTAYIDEELPPPRRREVEAHLPTCAGCRATLALLQGTLSRLATLPEAAPSPALRRNVLTRATREGRSWWEQLLGRWRSAFLFPALGAAAAAAMVALMVVLRTGQGTMIEMTEPGGLELAANYEVVRDLEVLGVDRPDDFEVVDHLDELEATP